MKHFLSRLMLSVIVASVVVGCGRSSADSSVDPKSIEAKYGLTGAYVDRISTEEGMVEATIVPTTLDDGRRVQLVIPHERIDDQHEIFIRDGVTITPMALSDPRVPRQDFVNSQPRVVERRPATVTTPKKKRSIEKEILIVGGSAGAGAAIGAAAGGKKGAAVGALSGGIAGLVYDLATRNK